jgi:transcriptional regulator with PAS, ATPase and Fis domain
MDACVSRRRDRRLAFADFLTALARALEQREDSTPMRDTFEQGLRRLLPVRTVQLRDGGGRPAKGQARQVPESITIDVPAPGPVRPGVLEASLEPGGRLPEWDLQTLGLAAHVGALVLEIDRCRAQLARAGLSSLQRVRRDGAAPLIGSTPVMQALRSTIERVSATEFTILLEGESGVGKELVARQIHELSRRRNGPFVAINCAALVETLLEAELFGIEDRTATGVRGRRGKFEAADGGTLFLDEVSDLSLSAQAKLLRAIQDLAVERVGGNGTHRVDIRVIAATNRSLWDLVHRQLFRPDLYYRLSGVDVHVPALRERRADIIELTQYFLARHRTMRTLCLSPEAADALIEYDWPGNVRELERLMERAVAFASSDMIGLDDLTPPVGGRHLAVLAPSLERRDTLRAWARRYVRIVLARSHGNKREAARVLGISYHTLQAYLRAPIDSQVPPADASALQARGPAQHRGELRE